MGRSGQSVVLHVSKHRLPCGILQPEFCTSQDLLVASTFVDKRPSAQATFRSIGVKHGPPFACSQYAQLDLVLAAQGDLSNILDVCSAVDEPLSTHHYAVIAEVAMDLAKGSRHAPCARKEWTLLGNPAISEKFAQCFEQSLRQEPADSKEGAPDVDRSEDINSMSASVASAFACAQDEVIPNVTSRPKRPWISSSTLRLIELRHQARLRNDHDTEARLCKEIKKAAKKDRQEWLTSLAGTGSWKDIRKLKGGAAQSQGRLHGTDGAPIGSECRAERFAQFLQDVQWAVRPTTLFDDSPVCDPLPVNLGSISMKELQEAAGSLRSGRAAGPDGKPIECWKAVLKNGESEGAMFLLSFCNEVWSGKCVPDDWHLHHVKMIFKKGDPSDCNNYRPICLLAAAYKLFAAVLLRRLRDAGAEGRIALCQSGFCRRRGTEDALHCARRAMELAFSQRGGQLHLLALDWRKAFDSISPDGLARSLRRFGIPDIFVQMVVAIYTNRRFRVAECGVESESYEQRFGIYQGCPLSPFLFIIVMQDLLDRARACLSPEAQAGMEDHQLFEILFADDTLVVGVSAAHVQEYAAAIARIGAELGMSLHWGKTQLLSIGSTQDIQDPNGEPIERRQSLIYLGGLLAADGRSDSELSRRLGLAYADYRRLAKLWGHAGVGCKRRLQFLRACVFSKLLYGLATMWLVKAQLRRLDGFQARCLRRVQGIPAAFVSRISNTEVLRRANSTPLSQQLLYRQLIIMGKVARSAAGSPLRQDTFVGNSLRPQVGRYIRKVGRPRQEWTTEVLKAGAAKFRDTLAFEDLLQKCSAEEWRWELDRRFGRYT